MARIDNINNFLTDVANSIRNKTGKTDDIPASEFDVEIESISGGGSEDLTEELNDYSTKLEAQKTSISSITKALAGKAGGSGRALNLFLQEDEPLLKEGLWLQTSNKYDGVAIVEGSSVQMTFAKTKKDNDIYIMDESAIELVGDYIYSFGGYTSSGVGAHKYAYKYGLYTNTWTRIKDVPQYVGYSMAVTIGTDIYLFGFWNYYNMYKYDTTADTYTSLAKPPQYTTGSLIVAVDNFIYVFSNDASDTHNKKASKYDVANNTWSTIANLPTNMTRAVVFALGTDIYMLGGHANASYKYDTIKNTYTKLNNSPYRFDRSPWYVDKTRDKVYIFSPGGPSQTSVFEYDYTNDTYELLNATLPYSVKCADNNVVDFNGQMLIVGGDGQTRSILDVTTNFLDVDSTPGKNLVTIYLNKDNVEGDYSCRLFNDSNIVSDISKYNTFNFNDVVYKSAKTGSDYTIPTYYGDGTRWIKFKN